MKISILKVSRIAVEWCDNFKKVLIMAPPYHPCNVIGIVKCFIAIAYIYCIICYALTRWNSSNGPVAWLLRWLIFMPCLVTYSHTCHMWSHLSHRYFSRKVIFLRELHFSMLHFPGSHISWGNTYPRKSHFPGRNIFLDVKYPGISNFLDSHIFYEVTFSGKSRFPGSH